MKKLLLISDLFLVVMYPSMVLAGNVYWNSSANLYSEPNKLPKAKGTASINYDASKWTITLKFSGLLKNKPYIFQISAQDQLVNKIDKDVTSDKSGNIDMQYTIDNLDDTFQNIRPSPYSTYDAPNNYFGYTILRLLDLTGASGGIKLADLEPTSATNPFLPTYPKATMVMRAREDGYRAELTFTEPAP